LRCRNIWKIGISDTTNSSTRVGLRFLERAAAAADVQKIAGISRISGTSATTKRPSSAIPKGTECRRGQRREAQHEVEAGQRQHDRGGIERDHRDPFAGRELERRHRRR
jgi:hypothetical protein